jgi:regulator of RNase E activity RraB
MSDHWEIYFTRVDVSPVAVLVDMGIADEAPREELGELVTLRISVLAPDEFGQPGAKEDETLDRLEDALQDGLAELDGETDYVGRMTMEGVRIMFYYTSEPAAVEACLRATMQTSPAYQHELLAEADPDWTRYFELLYPSERDQQIIGNSHILESLQQAGDNNDLEREVAHWTYFLDADSRSAFERAVHGLGYMTRDSRDQATGDNPFSLCISKVSAVNFETINGVVLELFDLAEAHNGEYTGWETTVQKTPR